MSLGEGKDEEWSRWCRMLLCSWGSMVSSEVETWCAANRDEVQVESSRNL